MIRFAVITLVGEEHVSSLGGQPRPPPLPKVKGVEPQAFPGLLGYMRAHCMGNSNQIVHGDQTACEL